MKELESKDFLGKKQDIESIILKQKEQEFTFIGSLNPKRGHNLWEINTKTLEVKLAEYKKEKNITWEEALHFYYGGKLKKTVVIQKDCVYISSLSKATALERYLSGKGSSQVGD